MAFGGLADDRATRPVAQINMIPLIDVMLVLLVIFMITAPLLTHAVKVDLPRATSQLNTVERDSVHLSISREGVVFWDGAPLAEGAWVDLMREAARRDPQPELHIHADGDLAYKRVAAVMSDAAAAGLRRIGFVTDPRDVR